MRFLRRFQIGRQPEQDLDDEIRAHLLMAIRERIERGEDPETAETNARREFGNEPLIKETTRDIWGWRWLEVSLQDLRYGVRQLRRTPGVTAVAVLTLALGIGANTAIFSAVNTVLFHPLPFKDPGRLVWVTQFIPRQGNRLVWDSDYFYWRRQNKVFDDLAAYDTSHLTLTAVGEPERLEAMRVTSGFFHVLGVEPILGRSFLADEDRPGGPQVCVLSHQLWERRFGADPFLVGKAVALDGKPYTVLGVLPARAESVNVTGAPPALYVPLNLKETAGVAPGTMHNIVWVIARLKPGTGVARAQSNLDLMEPGLQAGYKGGYAKMMAGTRPIVMSLHDRLVGNARTALVVLLGAVGFVLLIVCANVANLQLARAVTRAREMAIRTALGAGRGRLVRQLLTESVLMAALGATVGLMLANFTLPVLRTLGPADIPHLAEVQIDLRVLFFTALVAIAVGILSGLVPVIAATRSEPNESLKEGSVPLAVASAVRGRRLRSLLVAAELAMALVLLAGSGLLIRSFVRLTQIDPGFDAHHVLAARIDLPQNRYSQPERQQAFFTSLLERLSALPGMISAGATLSLPLEGSMMAAGFEIEGQPPTAEINTVADVDIVSPGYFRTLGVPLISGRDFTPRDNTNSPPVVLLNQACVRAFFPTSNPVGKRIRIANMPWATIAGVVGDVRQANLVSLPKPEIFESYLQNPYSTMVVVVRTTGDPLPLAPDLRSQVLSLDHNLPVSEISTVERVMSDQVAAQRFNMLLLGLFAFLALVLAAVGIYGVASYTVSQRTHEIGLRMALGAERSDVIALVLRQGLIWILSGVAIGLVAALFLTRLIASMLYEIRPLDPWSFAGTSTVLLAVALAANFLPARRALRVDPMVALRYE